MVNISLLSFPCRHVYCTVCLCGRLFQSTHNKENKKDHFTFYCHIIDHYGEYCTYDCCAAFTNLIYVALHLFQNYVA